MYLSQTTHLSCYLTNRKKHWKNRSCN